MFLGGGGWLKGFVGRGGGGTGCCLGRGWRLGGREWGAWVGIGKGKDDCSWAGEKRMGGVFPKGKERGGCGIGGCGEVVVTRRSAFMGESEAANGEASRGISLV